MIGLAERRDLQIVVVLRCCSTLRIRSRCKKPKEPFLVSLIALVEYAKNSVCGDHGRGGVSGVLEVSKWRSEFAVFQFFLTFAT